MFKRIIFGAVTVLLTAFVPATPMVHAESADPEPAAAFAWKNPISPLAQHSEAWIAASLTTSETQKLLDETTISIEWDKREVYPGRNIAVRLTVTSSSVSNAEALNLEVGLQLQPSDIPTNTIGNDLIGTQKVVTDVKVLLERGLAFTRTFRAPEEGTYRLVATLTITPEGQRPVPKTEERTFIVRSALPPGLAQLFSGLALFAAVMAIMAAGTEVIIESIKLAVGLKQKPTAMEAFMQLKAELPGQLANLGVIKPSSKDILALMKLVDDEREELNKTLARAPDGADLLEAVQTGALLELRQYLEERSKDEGKRRGQPQNAHSQQPAPAKEATKRERDISEAIENLVGRVNKLMLDKSSASGYDISSDLNNIRDDVVGAGKSLESIRDDILKGLATKFDITKRVNECLRAFQRHAVFLITHWLKCQIVDRSAEGASALISDINNEVVPLLGHIGFDHEAAKNAGKELKLLTLGVLPVAQDDVTLFVSATQALLKAVENTREKVQSPLRKLWRWIDDDQSLDRLFLSLVICGLIGGVCRGIATRPETWSFFLVGALWSGVFFSFLTLVSLRFFGSRDAHSKWESRWHVFADGRNPLKLRILWILCLAFVIVVCAMVAIGSASSALAGQLDGVPYAMLGVFIGASLAIVLHRAELHATKEIDTVRSNLDRVRSDQVAATLLQREEVHQDEETSRVRIMRVISIIVGCILAYAVEIDAIEILGQALPGIQVANPILGWVNQPFLGLGPLQHNLTAGMLLSGLAASAGSKFWRDFLGRLEAGKQQAEEAAIAIRRAKQALGQDEAQ